MLFGISIRVCNWSSIFLYKINLYSPVYKDKVPYFHVTLQKLIDCEHKVKSIVITSPVKFISVS